jgi:hypothetical protein
MEDKFFLFLDVLGFSELVLNNPQELVEKICDSELRQTAAACTMISAAMTGNLHRSFEVQASKHGALFDVRQDHINFHLLSDSVVAWTNDCSIEALVLLTNFAAQYLAQTIMLGLPHRGAISKGSIKIIDLPLNGRPQSNAVGSGLVKAHRFEGGQEWMGCVVDPECINGFSTQFVADWVKHPQSSLTTYDAPYKPNASFRSNFVVDWRVPFKMFGIATNAGYFQEQFARYNKPLNDNVTSKIENTDRFFAAHLA